MKPRVDVSTVGMREVVKSLSRMTGKSFKQVLDAEAGHIINNTIKNVPKLQVQKVVKYTLPEGVAHRKGMGGRKVTVEDGKIYHVGIPVPLPDDGGRMKYKYPKGRWMGQKGKNNGKFAKYIKQQKAKANERILRRGLSASQFYAMSVFLGIKLPKIPPKYVTKGKHYGVVGKHIKQSKRVGLGSLYYIMLASQGLKFSAPTKAQRLLTLSLNARKKFFVERVAGRTPANLKKFMPKNYPLLFK